MKTASIALVFLALAGCHGSERDIMPLSEKSAWVYQVHGPLADSVQTVAVVSRTAVAGEEGFRLSGAMGESRLVWKGPRLLASALGGTRFAPAIPLLDLEVALAGESQKEKAPVSVWTGEVTYAGRKERAKAAMSRQTETISWRDRRVRAERALLELKTPKTTHRITTWFVRGRGVVRQEHRVGARLVRSLEALSGP